MNNIHFKIISKFNKFYLGLIFIYCYVIWNLKYSIQTLNKISIGKECDKTSKDLNRHLNSKQAI